MINIVAHYEQTKTKSTAVQDRQKHIQDRRGLRIYSHMGGVL